MDSTGENELHKRIRDLEEEIKIAGNALKEAEDRLTRLERTKSPTMEHAEDINESHHVRMP